MSPAALLRAITMLLAPDWSRAMQAELAAISAPGERWRFALGCAAGTLGRPTTLRYALALVAAAGGVVALARPTGYPPMRAALIAMVVVLVVLGGLGARLYPVAAAPAARAIRIGGYLLVGALSLSTVRAMALATDNLLQKTVIALPAYTAMLILITVAMQAATARVATEISTLMIGAIAGLGAALVWLIPVAFAPPLPATNRGALVAVIVATAAAALLGRAHRILAALWASLTCSLLSFAGVDLVLRFAPDRWIPNLVPVALTPADDVANSRIEGQEPYLLLLAIAFVAAIAICALAARRLDQRPLPAAGHVIES